MRLSLLSFAALIALIAVLGPDARATQIAPGDVYSLRFYNLDQKSGNVGLFQYDWVTPDAVDDYSVYGYHPYALWDNADTNDGFYSFCIEESEQIHFNKTYDAELSLIDMLTSDDTAAVAGGTGAIDYGTFMGDPISNATAYLYYMFSTGQFGDLTDDSPNIPALGGGSNLTDLQAVDALQHAIWGYEEEVTLPNNWFTQQVDAYFGTGGDGAAYSASANYDAGPGGALFPKVDGTGAVLGRYVVYAVNTTYTDTGNLAQDTLFMGFIPGGTPSTIPEPTAVLIWGFGVCLVVLGRRSAK